MAGKATNSNRDKERSLVDEFLKSAQPIQKLAKKYEMPVNWVLGVLRANGFDIPDIGRAGFERIKNLRKNKDYILWKALNNYEDERDT